eukprot:m.111816 g.111816  ORF g.111816 m.111816 type:complete len:77 (-) comp28146_c0_seq1:1394-1624(-)
MFQKFFYAIHNPNDRTTKSVLNLSLGSNSLRSSLKRSAFGYLLIEDSVHSFPQCARASNGRNASSSSLTTAYAALG